MRSHLRFLLAGVAVILMAGDSFSFAQLAKVSIDEMTGASTSIVHARTSSVRSYWTENEKYIMTDITLEVESALKGSASSRTVVTIPGGRVGSTLYEVSDMPVFVEGEEVVVFVWRRPDGFSTVTGGVMGKLTVVNDRENNIRMVVGLSEFADPDKTEHRLSDPNDGAEVDDNVPIRISLDDLKRKIIESGEK